jgi:hypothetical protein
LKVVRICASVLLLCASLRGATPAEWAGKAERLIRSGNPQEAGITNWQLGDFSATIREMKAAIAIRTDYAEAHYMLGIVLKQTGDLDGALPEFKGDKQGSAEAFATGARLKRKKEGQLTNTLEQGMRGGTFPKPLSAPPG